MSAGLPLWHFMRIFNTHVFLLFLHTHVHTLFSWVPLRPCTTSVGYRTQRPSETRLMLTPGKSSLGSCMCCAVPALSLLNWENWGEEAGLTQREERGLSEGGVKECRVKTVFKGNECFLQRQWVF